MTRLRNYFLTGFIVCAPLAITAYIAWSFIGWVDSWVKPYIPAKYDPDTYMPFPVPGFGLIVAIFLITDRKGAAAVSVKTMETIVLPDVPEFIAPMVYALPIQLLAYYTAVFMGTDVDQPRNLAKSVTVE